MTIHAVDDSQIQRKYSDVEIWQQEAVSFGRFIEAWETHVHDQDTLKRIYGVFENHLSEIKKTAENSNVSSCFVSYSTGEEDVEMWMDYIFLPHLNKAGVQVYCSRNLPPGEDIIDFQKTFSGPIWLLFCVHPKL